MALQLSNMWRRTWHCIDISLLSFIVPRAHLIPNENVDFYYANYEEHWGSILDFFRP